MFVETLRVLDGFKLQDANGVAVAEIRFVPLASQVSGRTYGMDVLEIHPLEAYTGVMVTGTETEHNPVEYDDTVAFYPFV